MMTSKEKTILEISCAMDGKLGVCIFNESKGSSKLAWLDDVRGKPSLEDRILAQQVLEAGGVDHKGILTEVDRQGLSLTDMAVEELREHRGE